MAPYTWNDVSIPYRKPSNDTRPGQVFTAQKEFQFLIGNLVTRLGQETPDQFFHVSIPYRKPSNPHAWCRL